MYAYPQRPGAVAGPPPTAFAQPSPQMTPQQHPPSAYVPPPPPVIAPGAGLYSVPSGSVTTLRLKLAEDVRIDPPVAVSSALLPSSGPQAAPTLDLSLEKKLVGEAEGKAQSSEGGQADAAGAGGSSDGAVPTDGAGDVKAFLAGIKPGEVPQDPAVKKVEAMGAPAAAAALGVIYARPGRGGPEKAADFASKVEQLTTMGFSLATASGALAKHKNDLEAATESCLSTAS